MGLFAKSQVSPVTVEIPRSIYFYYLRENADGHFDIEEYLVPRTSSAEITQREVEDLISVAKHNNMPQHKQADQITEWTEHSYIAFGMDNPTHSLGAPGSVVFNYKWLLIFHLSNHNFDTETYFSVPNSNVSGIWFINQRVRRSGGRLRAGDREKFRVRFPGLRRFSFLFVFFAHNESGTNIGP